LRRDVADAKTSQDEFERKIQRAVLAEALSEVDECVEDLQRTQVDAPIAYEEERRQFARTIAALKGEIAVLRETRTATIAEELAEPPGAQDAPGSGPSLEETLKAIERGELEVIRDVAK